MAFSPSPVRALAIAAAAMLSLSGCYQGTQLSQGAPMHTLLQAQEKTRNAQLLGNMRTLQMALEEYAVDHLGRYPATLAALTPLEPAPMGNYLPGNQLPVNPWSTEGFRQGNTLGTAGARPLLAPVGLTPTAIGTALGAGKPAGSDAYDAWTYGALVYDVDLATQRYTLYAIGKQGDQAVVVGGVTNAP